MYMKMSKYYLAVSGWLLLSFFFATLGKGNQPVLSCLIYSALFILLMLSLYRVFSTDLLRLSQHPKNSPTFRTRLNLTINWLKRDPNRFMVSRVPHMEYIIAQKRCYKQLIIILITINGIFLLTLCRIIMRALSVGD